MKYAVVYQSMTGNTRRIAEIIYNELDTPDKVLIDIDKDNDIPIAETYFVGFGVRNENCSMGLIDAFDQMQGENIALFATCGLLPADQYRVHIENQVGIWLPDDMCYFGMFMCQGNTSYEGQEKLFAKYQGREAQIQQMLEEGEYHPNNDDEESVRDFVRSIVRSL